MRPWRPVLAAVLALSLLVAPLPADAQQPPRVPRIGVLFSTTESGGAPYLEAFRQGLGDLGWVEGKTIALDCRWAEGKPDRRPGWPASTIPAFRLTGSS